MGRIFLPWGNGLFDVLDYSSACALSGVYTAVLVFIVCRRSLSSSEFRDCFIYLTTNVSKADTLDIQIRSHLRNCTILNQNANSIQTKNGPYGNPRRQTIQ